MQTKNSIIEILKNVKYKDWTPVIGQDQDRLYFRWMWKAPDATCRQPHKVLGGRKWFLSPYMTKSEVINTAFMAALAAEEHECREFFKYNGQPIYGPHWDVDKLAGLMATGIATDEREHPGEQHDTLTLETYFGVEGGVSEFLGNRVTANEVLSNRQARYYDENKGVYQ